MKHNFLNARQMAAGPGTGPLAGYTLVYTPADIAALTPATIADFVLGFKWQYRVQIGQKNTGTDQAPVWEAQYALRNRTVNEATINQDLMDFQQQLKKGNAYKGAVVPGRETDQLLTSGGLTLLEQIAAGQNTRKMGEEEAEKDLEKVARQWNNAHGNFRPNYVFEGGDDEGISDEEAEENISQAKADEEQKTKELEQSRAEHMYAERNRGAIGLMIPEPEAKEASASKAERQSKKESEAKEEEPKKKNGNNGGKKH